MENSATPPERLDESLMTRQHLYRQLQEVITSRHAYDKDKIAAANAALEVLPKIDDLMGASGRQKRLSRRPRRRCSTYSQRS